MRRLRILYVVGPTRSGSTLLARVLNEFPGVWSAGEVVSLDVVLQSCRNQGLSSVANASTFVPNCAADGAARRFSGLCGCGLPVQDCQIWARVEKAVFGDPPDYTPWSWDASRPSAPRLVLRGTRRWLEQDAGELGRVARSIYSEIAEITGAEVIVDESKTPLYGWFLANQAWADVVPVRLVRDPRETVASWSRPKPYPGIESGALPAHGTPAGTVEWLKRVVLADRLFRDAPLVRYEDLVEAPVEISSRLLARFGLGDRPPVVGDRHALPVATNHIIAGNPDKFERGVVEMRPRSGSSARLRWRDRALVTAATFPLLCRYGYRQRP